MPPSFMALLRGSNMRSSRLPPRTLPHGLAPHNHFHVVSGSVPGAAVPQPPRLAEEEKEEEEVSTAAATVDQIAGALPLLEVASTATIVQDKEQLKGTTATAAVEVVAARVDTTSTLRLIPPTLIWCISAFVPLHDILLAWSLTSRRYYQLFASDAYWCHRWLSVCVAELQATGSTLADQLLAAGTVDDTPQVANDRLRRPNDAAGLLGAARDEESPIPNSEEEEEEWRVERVILPPLAPTEADLETLDGMTFDETQPLRLALLQWTALHPARLVAAPNRACNTYGGGKRGDQSVAACVRSPWCSSEILPFFRMQAHDVVSTHSDDGEVVTVHVAKLLCLLERCQGPLLRRQNIHLRMFDQYDDEQSVSWIDRMKLVQEHAERFQDSLQLAVGYRETVDLATFPVTAELTGEEAVRQYRSYVSMNPDHVPAGYGAYFCTVKPHVRATISEGSAMDAVSSSLWSLRDTGDSVFSLRDLFLAHWMLRRMNVAEIKHFQYARQESKMAICTTLIGPRGTAAEFRLFYSTLGSMHPRVFLKGVYRPAVDLPAETICSSFATGATLFVGGFGRVEVDIRPRVEKQSFLDLRSWLRLPDDFSMELLWNVVMAVSGAGPILSQQSSSLLLHYDRTFTEAFQEAMK